MLIPISFHVIFIFLVMLVLSIFLIMVKLGESKISSIGLTKKIGFGVLLWLIVTHISAQAHFFENWEAMPPRLIFIIIIPIIGIIYLLNNSGFSGILNNIPIHWLIYFQSFRFFLELFLHALYESNIIPIQMTFEGYNFDIIMGISAPIVGFLAQKNMIKKQLLLGWNVLGILLVTAIVIISATSTPSPIRLFLNEPSNTFIGFSPFVWLPGFLVPMAYFFHFLAIKKLIGKSN